MRTAGALLLVAACSSDAQPQLAVDLSAAALGVSVSDARCSCHVDADGCEDFTDVGVPTPCDCEPIDCISSITVTKGSAMAQQVDKSLGVFMGHWDGGEVTIEGCGDSVTIPVPTEYPAPPTFVSAVPSPGGSRVEWSATPPTTSVIITVGSFAGTSCRLPVTTSSREFRTLGATQAGVHLTSMIEQPVFETFLGPAYVSASTNAAPP